MSKGAARGTPEWEIYERLIAHMFAQQSETDMCVTANAYIVGRITGVRRQIDVLIETRHDTDNSRRIIVDAKKRSRKVDVKEVESFRGLMEDVGATHGYLVSPVGYTKAAERRAQSSVFIRIVTLDRLEGFDPSAWPKCRRQRCEHGRVFWDGYPEISLKSSPVDGSASVVASCQHYVGKCDRCGRFHVWCLACNDVMAPTEEEDDCGLRCSCQPLWFWLASIEEDEGGNRSAELHVCFATGQVATIDRRSL